MHHMELPEPLPMNPGTLELKGQPPCAECRSLPDSSDRCRQLVGTFRPSRFGSASQDDKTTTGRWAPSRCRCKSVARGRDQEARRFLVLRVRVVLRADDLRVERLRGVVDSRLS